MTNETNEIPVTQIALCKLIPWDGNVRKTGAADGIDELAASIEAHGLLQSLLVREAGDGRRRGKFEVVAGRRRYLALRALAKKKKIAKDYPVPCRLANGSIDAAELSLAENVVRAPMHPADQFDAFRGLADEGASVAEVAARFGVSEDLVMKRMKLGRISPVILDAYRRGEVSLEIVQAFTVSDDHEAQERIWTDMPAWDLHPHTIRRALTEGEMPASDKRVKLVGLEAYEAAGGAVRRDLFDPKDGGYVLNAELLDNLVAKTLEEAANEVRSEGWRWVEIVPDLDYGDLRGFSRLRPECVPLSDEHQAELDDLSEEYDELVDTEDDAGIARIEEIERRIDELEAQMDVWPAETLAVAGAIVSIGYHGDICVERGLVRPEDRPAAEHESDADDADGGAAEEPAIKMSARLIEDLTAQRSAAISAEMTRRPDIALAAVVHSLALQHFYSYQRQGSCLQIEASGPFLQGSLYAPEACSGLAALEAKRERWGDRLPGDPSDLWTWCLEQPQDTLLDLLAVTAASAVDAVVLKDGSRHPHTDQIACAVSLDMAHYFTPTADNFFTHVNGAGIQAAIGEARSIPSAPAWGRLRKSELAAMAERHVKGTGWLPEPLRITAGADAMADASESRVTKTNAFLEAIE